MTIGAAFLSSDYFGLFVCGGSLTSGQLFMGSFQTGLLWKLLVFEYGQFKHVQREKKPKLGVVWNLIYFSLLLHFL